MLNKRFGKSSLQRHPSIYIWECCQQNSYQKLQKVHSMNSKPLAKGFYDMTSCVTPHRIIDTPPPQKMQRRDIKLVKKLKKKPGILKLMSSTGKYCGWRTTRHNKSTAIQHLFKSNSKQFFSLSLLKRQKFTGLKVAARAQPLRDQNVLLY